MIELLKLVRNYTATIGATLFIAARLAFAFDLIDAALFADIVTYIATYFGVVVVDKGGQAIAKKVNAS